MDNKSNYFMNEQEHFKQLSDAGWQQLNASGGFTGHVGPYWKRKHNGQVAVGLVVDERHTNSHLGTLHGGALMTFADIGLGFAIVEAMGSEAHRCVTTSLNTQFVGIAKVGDFIRIEPELVRQTKNLLFVRGLILAGEKVIANVDGIWSVLGNP